jgi:hypothetical protein
VGAGDRGGRGDVATGYSVTESLPPLATYTPGCTLTVKVRVLEAVWWAGAAESVAVTVNVNVPESVGVPATFPPGDSDRSDGSAPAVIAHVSGPTPPVAASVVE